MERFSAVRYVDNFINGRDKLIIKIIGLSVPMTIKVIGRTIFINSTERMWSTWAKKL